MSRKWNELQLREAAATSRSLAQVLIQLGLKPAGGNYQTIRQALIEYQIDTTHWSAQAWRKGTQVPSRPARPLDEILVNGSQFKSSHLRRRLLTADLLDNSCYLCCSPPEWLGEPLTLHLDHINGDHQDNRIENLRLLCPNCHSQTDTYCSRNKNRVPLPLG